MGVGGSRISLLAPVRAYAAAAFAADVAARQRDVHPGGARRLDRPGGGGRPRPCYAAPPVDHQRSCQPSAAPLGALPMFHGAGGLAAHHRFGARSGAAPLLLGLGLLAIALLPGGLGPALLAAIPAAGLGAMLFLRSEESGVGDECGSTCSTRGAPFIEKKKP